MTVFTKQLITFILGMLLALCCFCFVFCSGCNANQEILAGQSEATDIVWTKTYNIVSSIPPKIEWVLQSDLDCWKDDGQFIGFYRTRFYGDVGKSDVCVGGTTYLDWNFSQIALPDGFKISDTAFAHELLHVMLWYSTGDPDGSHTGPAWQSNGLKDRANVALKEAGL